MSNYLKRNNDLDFVKDNFLHELFGYPMERDYKNLMKTDVLEKENGFEILVDLPGYTKDDIKISIEKGYLIVEGKKESTNEEEKKDRYLRKERFYGTVSRTYYLGDEIEENSIKAFFKDGVLNIFVPKEDKKDIENKKYITIE